MKGTEIFLILTIFFVYNNFETVIKILQLLF